MLDGFVEDMQYVCRTTEKVLSAVSAMTRWDNACYNDSALWSTSFACMYIRK